MASVPKILLDNVAKEFAGNTVLDGLNLAVEPGESLAIIGQSGSGKSVTLKCILGLITPDRGSIRVDGEEVVGLRGAALWQLGSEDPALWSFFNRERLFKRVDPKDLERISFDYEVSFLGRGEILNVQSR